jgi:hypothetical protein
VSGCDGPVLWFNVDDSDLSLGAVLECARPGCGFIIATGQFFDDAHMSADILREGFAS